MPKDVDKIRLSLELSPEASLILDELVSGTSSTKSDVIRRGLALMKVAVDAKKSGHKFGVADNSEKLITEIVGI